MKNKKRINSQKSRINMLIKMSMMRECLSKHLAVRSLPTIWETTLAIMFWLQCQAIISVPHFRLIRLHLHHRKLLLQIATQLLEEVYLIRILLNQAVKQYQHQLLLLSFFILRSKEEPRQVQPHMKVDLEVQPLSQELICNSSNSSNSSNCSNNHLAAFHFSFRKFERKFLKSLLLHLQACPEVTNRSKFLWEQELKILELLEIRISLVFRRRKSLENNKRIPVSWGIKVIKVKRISTKLIEG